jgi:hypothetical protein
MLGNRLRAPELDYLKVVMRTSAVEALTEACPAHTAEDELASKRTAISRTEHRVRLGPERQTTTGNTQMLQLRDYRCGMNDDSM